MSIITISREFGSGGGKIAEAVAARLGYHLVDKQSLGRILGAYGLVSFSDEYESPLGFWANFDGQIKEMVGMLDRATRAVARHGDAVILGRGSFAILCGFTDVLHVRIKAPFERRVDRVMSENGPMERAVAENTVREGDRVRSSFVQTMYGMRWDLCSVFDLVVDLGKISPESATSFILEAARGLPASGRPGARCQDITADDTLDQTVAEVLGCAELHRVG
ncbi:MAG TPA: cytidylate kinase-like family protein [Rectinemataceae bacterium]|nr:cytidylate kinase-like family protein [Rectinemataceae bacterium]